MLGPVRLNQPDGAEIRLSSERQRRRLAALALHGGRVTDTGVLVEMIWGSGEGAAPDSPPAAVHTLVARLRKLLPPGVSVVTEGRGYRLQLATGQLDSEAFVAHVHAAGATAQPVTQLEELAAAVSLWRGRPFPELDHPDVAPEVAHLCELRCVVIEQQAEALLALGRAGEAVAALESLAVAEPLREGATALPMRALCGRGPPGGGRCAPTPGGGTPWSKSWASTRPRSCAASKRSSSAKSWRPKMGRVHSLSARPSPACP